MSIVVQHGSGAGTLAAGMAQALGGVLEQRRQEGLLDKELKAKQAMEDYKAQKELELYKGKIDFDIQANQIADQQKLVQMTQVDQIKFEREVKRQMDALNQMDMELKALGEAESIKDNPAALERNELKIRLKAMASGGFTDPEQVGIRKPQTLEEKQFNMLSPEQQQEASEVATGLRPRAENQNLPTVNTYTGLTPEEVRQKNLPQEQDIGISAISKMTQIRKDLDDLGLPTSSFDAVLMKALSGVGQQTTGNTKPLTQAELDVLPHPKTVEEFNKLPSGSIYVDTDGKPYPKK